MSKDKFCWSKKGDEIAHGPCDSFDEAVAEALECLGPGAEAEVGRCDFISVHEFLPDADDILETANERAYDECPWQDDPMIEIKEGLVAKAKAALDKALADWADQYLDVPVSYRMVGARTVRLCGEVEEREPLKDITGCDV